MRRSRTLSGLPIVLAALLLAIPAGSAEALTGGPDGFGYSFTDSQEPGGPAFSFEDISVTGTTVPSASSCDDCVSGSIPIGFTFRFYGIDRTTVNVSSNGFLSFSQGSSACCIGQPIPQNDFLNGIIAGWWTDLYPPAGGGVRYQTLGSQPSRRFVVQFTNVPHFGFGSPVTMQFKLFESSNAIEVHYQSAIGSRTTTAGIENATGSTGLQYFFGNPGTLTNRAVRYSLPGGPGLDVDSAHLTAYVETGVNP